MPAPARSFGAVRGLGNLPADSWAPFRYQTLAAEQWNSQFSDATSSPTPAPDSLEGRVQKVVDALADQHAEAGMRLARAYGPLFVQGARLYIDLRAASEEELAERVAELNARSARRDDQAARVQAAFLKLRLADVRRALQRAATPPQAVADLPEIPTQKKWRVPRVATYVLMAMSAIGLGITIYRSRR